MCNNRHLKGAYFVIFAAAVEAVTSADWKHIQRLDKSNSKPARPRCNYSI
jgi:hypothetical protein